MYVRTNLGDYGGLKQLSLTLQLQLIDTGFTSPVDACFYENLIYVADQTGMISLLPGQLPVLDLSSTLAKLKPTRWLARKGLSTGYDERGLLGICLHPNFPKNPRVYVYYSVPNNNKKFNHTGRLSVFKFTDLNTIDSRSEKILLEVPQERGSHNGGGLHFGPDGYLYLSLGDGERRQYKKGEMGHAQNIQTPKGAILRMAVGGDTVSAAPNNPLIKSGGHPLIWAYGLRNPWRFSFDKDTGRCFVGDVGDKKREAIYQVKAGNNCGWRITEGSLLRDPDLANKLGIKKQDLTDPIFEYGPDLGRSVIGGYVYRGKQRPDLNGLYIFADASMAWPWQLAKKPTGQLHALKETKHGWHRIEIKTNIQPGQLITSLAQDPSGELFVLTKRKFGPVGNTGAVYRIT